MQLEGYQTLLAGLPFGKRLPTAVYVFREGMATLGAELDLLVAQVVGAFQVGPEFNVIKFRTDELKISFLCYPRFFEDPHPALRHAITIDLVRGKARHSDYGENLNPPILHRKEAFLPVDHPKREVFSALTEAEEAAGLYADTTTIGFKLNWERLVAAKGLRYAGHRLVKVESRKLKAESGGKGEEADGEWLNAEGSDHLTWPAPTLSQPSSGLRPPSPAQRAKGFDTEREETVSIERHKTALTRYDLSKPVKTLLEYGMLKTGTTFFDYGCGQGSDVRGLQALGHQAEGWDPVHRADAVKREADVVNLGYVLNVIEDPAERVEALVDAHRHARRLLVVSGLINETVDTSRARQFSDGVLTRANTFQKFFEQQELQQYIEDALDSTAVPVALGVFYVFRNPADQQDFLFARSRRTIDWTQISARLGLGGPRTLWKALYDANKELLDGFGKLALDLGRFPEATEFKPLVELTERLGSAKRALRAFVQGGGADGVEWNEVRVRFGIGQAPKRRWEVLYEQHRELLEGFWSLMLQLGRLPEAEEFPQISELREKIGSPKQALRMFIQKGGAEEMRNAAENRKRDLLVYVALANLRKRVPFGHLSLSLRSDIRAFFGNYTKALEKGLELLYAAGDPGEIELACEDLKLGWQDEQALYVHRSLVEQLPSVLRAYVGCATTLFGDVQQADVVKLHKASGKVTFLAYDDFDGKPLPELRARIKVNLRTRWVQVFDHSAEGQLLYFKERLLAADHPRLPEMQAFSAKLRKAGIPAQAAGGPAKAELLQLLEERGLNENLNKRRAGVRSRTVQPT